MGQNNWIAVGVQDTDDTIGFNERLDFFQNQRPLQLIIWLVSTRIVYYLFVQLLQIDKIPLV